MKNERICRVVLERMLHIKIGKIEYPTLQKSISPFYESKGIRLDVYRRRRRTGHERLNGFTVGTRFCLILLLQNCSRPAAVKTDFIDFHFSAAASSFPSGKLVWQCPSQNSSRDCGWKNRLCLSYYVPSSAALWNPSLFIHFNFLGSLHTIFIKSKENRHSDWQVFRIKVDLLDLVGQNIAEQVIPCYSLHMKIKFVRKSAKHLTHARHTFHSKQQILISHTKYFISKRRTE